MFHCCNTSLNTPCKTKLLLYLLRLWNGIILSFPNSNILWLNERIRRLEESGDLGYLVISLFIPVLKEEWRQTKHFVLATTEGISFPYSTESLEAENGWNKIQNNTVGSTIPQLSQKCLSKTLQNNLYLWEYRLQSWFQISTEYESALGFTFFHCIENCLSLFIDKRKKKDYT